LGRFVIAVASPTPAASQRAQARALTCTGGGVLGAGTCRCGGTGPSFEQHIYSFRTKVLMGLVALLNAMTDLSVGSVLHYKNSRPCLQLYITS